MFSVVFVCQSVHQMRSPAITTWTCSNLFPWGHHTLMPNPSEVFSLTPLWVHPGGANHNDKAFMISPLGHTQAILQTPPLVVANPPLYLW